MVPILNICNIRFNFLLYLKALKFSKDVHGETAIEVVDPLLLLAQISLGTKLYTESESVCRDLHHFILGITTCVLKIVFVSSKMERY